MMKLASLFVCSVLLVGCGREFPWPPTGAADSDLGKVNKSGTETPVKPSPPRVDADAAMSSVEDKINLLEMQQVTCDPHTAQIVVSDTLGYEFCLPITLKLTAANLPDSTPTGEPWVRWEFSYQFPDHLASMLDGPGFVLVSQMTLEVYHTNGAADNIRFVPQLDDGTNPLPILRVGNQEYYRFFTPGVTGEVNYVLVYGNLLYKFTCKAYPSVMDDPSLQAAVDTAFMTVIQSLELR